MKQTPRSHQNPDAYCIYKQDPILSGRNRTPLRSFFSFFFFFICVLFQTNKTRSIYVMAQNMLTTLSNFTKLLDVTKIRNITYVLLCLYVCYYVTLFHGWLFYTRHTLSPFSVLYTYRHTRRHAHTHTHTGQKCSSGP